MTNKITDADEKLIKSNVELCIKCDQKDELIEMQSAVLRGYLSQINRLRLDAKSTNHYLDKALREIETFREAI